MAAPQPNQEKFFKKDYSENYAKINNHIKKAFDARLENVQNVGDLSCYSSDYEDEEIFTTRNTLKLNFDGEEVEVPADLLKLDDLSMILNKENYANLFSVSEKVYLKSLLPEDQDHDQILNDLFEGKPFFHTNPLKTFSERLKAGTYTKTHQKINILEDRLSKIMLKNYHSMTSDLLDIKLDRLKTKEVVVNNLSYLVKRNALIDLESMSEDSELSVESINEIKVENSIDEISECETVIEVAQEELKLDMGDLDDELFENRKIEQRVLAMEIFKTKRPEPEPIMPSLNIPKFNKVTKNILTIKQNPKEWVEKYRQQERDRYSHPTRSWTYKLPENLTAIVAPVAKKVSTAQNSKAREHPLLKPDRPSYITILCLVRDAAAYFDIHSMIVSRLPNGVGTRADICELLKESQYVNENIPDDKMSNIVSGALDRLHYEDDPCVKYDSEKKLWIYLHRDRTEDYAPWVDQSDSRSSRKKEYNEKYKAKKKQKGDEEGGLSLLVEKSKLEFS